MNVTVAQFAASNGVTPATVYGWIRKGLIESKRSGRSTLVPARQMAPASGKKVKSRQEKSKRAKNEKTFDRMPDSVPSIIADWKAVHCGLFDSAEYKLWHTTNIRVLGDLGGAILEDQYLREALFVAITSRLLRVPIDQKLTIFPKAEARHVDSVCNFFTCDPQLSASEIITDVLPKIHHSIFTPTRRHEQGQYFTPSAIADELIKQLRLNGAGKLDDKHPTVLDPSCGLGAFLVSYARSMKAGSSVHLVGIDVNWGCVEATRLCMSALAFELRAAIKITYVVHCADCVVEHWDSLSGTIFAPQVSDCRSIPGSDSTAYSNLEPELRRVYAAGWEACYTGINADIAVGNPPWLQWSALADGYRQRTAEQWKDSGLFLAKGWASKIAAGKTDISMLFVHKTASKHLKCGGLMSFLLPIALFQGRRSGEGFRHFRMSNGKPYALLQIDDLSEITGAFSDAVNRPAAGYWRTGEPTNYPVTYRVLTKISQIRAAPNDPKFKVQTHKGKPISSAPGDPIIKMEDNVARLLSGAGPSDYRARGGVNTGGANPILYLQSESRITQKSKSICIKNIGRTRKSEAPVESATVEIDTVFSMLHGTDIQRWSCSPSDFIFLPYSPKNPKHAISEQELKNAYPKAYEYIFRFRDALVSRKEYIRWGCKGPFYESYRIGDYTFADYKVVWQHTGFRGQLKACVPRLDPLGRPVIPDQKVILIAAFSEQEAHYICAYINSRPVSTILSTYLGIDASTHILDYIGLKHFSPNNARHQELSYLSRQAHSAAEQKTGKDSIADIEAQIDRIVEGLLCGKEPAGKQGVQNVQM